MGEKWGAIGNSLENMSGTWELFALRWIQILWLHHFTICEGSFVFWGFYSIVGFDESSLNLLGFFPIFNTKGLSSKDLIIKDWRAKDQLIAEAPILVIISNNLLVHCICWRLDKQTSATNCCLHRSCILSFMRCTELWRRWCDYVHPLWNTNHTNFRCFFPFWIYKSSLVYDKNHQLQLRHYAVSTKHKKHLRNRFHI
jgi:hypothetical protein